MQLDVFISHSHKDKNIADAICHYFEENKLKCWIAPRDIKGGTSWAKAIADAIPSCKIFLLIFSKHADMSDQVLREVELAVKNKLIVVPVRIEDTTPTGGMEYYLSTVHWIDAINPQNEAYLKSLTEQVQGFIDSKKAGPRLIAPDDKKSFINNNITPIIIGASVVVILVVLGIVFRDNLFKSNQTILQEPTAIAHTNTPTSEPTAESTVTPTTEPTPTPTAEPTASSTPTIDPNISLDTVVDIPDVALKAAVLRTLDEMGEQVQGNVTVGDMQKLISLSILPQSWYDPEMDGWNEGYRVFHIPINTEIKTLEGLQYASNLKLLSIEGVGLEDISALSHLYKIETLSFAQNNISDISSLSNLSNLTMFNCGGNRISDISSMILMYNMDWLCMSDNPITDIRPLKDMSRLTILIMDNMDLSDLSPVSGMLNLNTLSVYNNPLKNIDGLANLPKLRKLHMVNCGLIDISAIEGAPELQELYINKNDIEVADSLSSLDKLERLVIDEDVQTQNEEIINELIDNGCEVLNETPSDDGM